MSKDIGDTLDPSTPLENKVELLLKTATQQQVTIERMQDDIRKLRNSLGIVERRMDGSSTSTTTVQHRSPRT